MEENMSLRVPPGAGIEDMQRMRSVTKAVVEKCCDSGDLELQSLVQLLALSKESTELRDSSYGAGPSDTGSLRRSGPTDLDATVVAAHFGGLSVKEDEASATSAGRGAPPADAYRELYCCPPGADPAVWQLENIRQFTMELSALAVTLNDHCTKDTCPQMKATEEWMYLCAAHKQPQECSAADYVIHTLDGTCSLLTSTKWCEVCRFPSRNKIPDSSLKYFQSITRRLYRILSHTFFHHQDVFDAFEREHRLCIRFVTFAQAFDLIPPKLLIIPESGYTSTSSTHTSSATRTGSQTGSPLITTNAGSPHLSARTSSQE